MRSLIGELSDPNFRFTDRADALETLEMLGKKLAMVREEERLFLDLIRLAAAAARRGTVCGQTVSAQAMIDNSGVSRQTIFEAFPPTAEPHGSP